VTGKPEWGSGPWDEEPDELLWWDERTGLPCLVLRHPELGSLNGYVGVHPGHPWFQKSGDDGESPDVHGGLTFANYGGFTLANRIKDWSVLRLDGFWWLGFDCNHSGDLVPGLRARMRAVSDMSARLDFEVYRTFDYAKAEVTELAKQAGEAGGVTMLLLAYAPGPEE
jgi:hypothetical protein